MRRYPHLIFTTGLFLLLVPAFALTLWKPYWEPYPALILPGGAHVTANDGTTFSYQTTEMLAVPAAADTLRQLDLNAVFPYADATRMTVIVGRQLYWDVSTPTEQADIRRWISARLAGANYRTDSVALRRRRLWINIADGTLARDTILHYRVIDLH